MRNLVFLRRHAVAILLAVLFLPIACAHRNQVWRGEVPSAVEAGVLRSESVSRGRWTSLQSNPRKTHHATVTYDLASRGQYSEVVSEEIMPKDAVILVWADPAEFNRAYGTRSVPCATGLGRSCRSCQLCSFSGARGSCSRTADTRRSVL